MRSMHSGALKPGKLGLSCNDVGTGDLVVLTTHSLNGSDGVLGSCFCLFMVAMGSMVRYARAG